ncbi:MAG: cytochrome ubiquinol oxidase subunit I [Anaerolineae bacterium]|nr:cytochrome ubiquinol oxidase subunit I [Anaerolineae bacterium]
MHYPWWYVPMLTAPMLIAAIAVIHVYVAMYAVGGGIFLAMETSHAYKTGNQDYLAYLKEHTWFFIMLTVVFGAITGVGIWWTIGLASPLATEALIHTFVFGWAMEYVFFVLEIASAFIFFYYWGKLPSRTHQTIGWIYAVSAWISLVIIAAITAFMLNPGAWVQNHDFWTGFLNPQFYPQTIARTGGSLVLAALYVYLHATWRSRNGDFDLMTLISKRSARFGLVGGALVIVGGVWWFIALPESAKAALAAAALLNIMMGIVLASTALVIAMLYLVPYRNPRWVTFGFAIMLFSVGFVAVGSGEFLREAVRKPFIIYNVVLSNQITPQEVDPLRESGYLEGGVWTHAYIAENYPQAVSADGEIDEAALLALPEADRLEVGEVLFQYHCNDCHASSIGLAPVGVLTQGWAREMILAVVKEPHKARFFMPPFAGTDEEAELLTDYLESIASPYPSGMDIGTEP